MEIIWFLSNIRKCNNTYGANVFHVQGLFFIYFSAFLLPRVEANFKIKHIYASGWFVRMENNNRTRNTNSYV